MHAHLTHNQHAPDVLYSLLPQPPTSLEQETKARLQLEQLQQKVNNSLGQGGEAVPVVGSAQHVCLWRKSSKASKMEWDSANVIVLSVQSWDCQMLFAPRQQRMPLPCPSVHDDSLDSAACQADPPLFITWLQESVHCSPHYRNHCSSASLFFVFKIHIHSTPPPPLPLIKQECEHQAYISKESWLQKFWDSLLGNQEFLKKKLLLSNSMI